ncbi:MAG: nicotinate (nicotinamide) nucleotide adenylyltransferase [Planctomycetota bacterium]|nr:nicotinate (nicotinamide) nucleotide adenylyltransferase [Planctomycetota bacterium]MDI6787737.1 nicotinate (nicotinamide) nucleotide adenylyltransferase [Planctomycetota bacterium]
MKRIIIFGGTFNPVHNAHLKIFRFILRKFKPHKFVFIPCNIPYHKGHQDIISGHHRLQMLKIVIDNLGGEASNIEVSDMEIKRGGKTFSIQTILRLKRQYPSDTRFYFVIGSDSLVGLSRWYKIEEMVKLCGFITVDRPGFPFNKLLKRLPFSDIVKKEMRKLYSKKPCIDISSHQVRELIRKGISIRGFVPPEVEDYIRKNGLYR